MSDAAPERRGYPYMSTQVWALLRARLRASVPAVITGDYLQSVLNVSAKAAGNILPQLRNLGLIDRDGVPQQPLVSDLREDDTYAAACRHIIEAVYPQTLLDAFPDPHDNVDGVAGWFRRNANTGDHMANLQAKFLALLSSGVPPVPGERPARERTTDPPRKATKQLAKPAKKSPASAASARTVRNGAGESQGPPEVHIDVQIHIDASASADQIEAIFASMAKHLYDK